MASAKDSILFEATTLLIASSAKQEQRFPLMETTIADIQDAVKAGEVSCR